MRSNSLLFAALFSATFAAPIVDASRRAEGKSLLAHVTDNSSFGAVYNIKRDVADVAVGEGQESIDAADAEEHGPDDEKKPSKSTPKSGGSKSSGSSKGHSDGKKKGSSKPSSSKPSHGSKPPKGSPGGFPTGAPSGGAAPGGLGDLLSGLGLGGSTPGAAKPPAADEDCDAMGAGKVKRHGPC